MKVCKLFSGSIEFVLMSAAIGAILLTSSMALSQGKKEQTTSSTKWEWSDDSWKLSVAINGKAEFTDDYSDVRSVSEGGSVRIEEDRGGQTRRVEVRRDANGQLMRSYSVNGESRALDSEAREWMSKLLLQAVRGGAIDVDPRVLSLLRRRGVSGVLEEIEQVSGEYAKRIYFASLVKNGNLTSGDQEKVLKEVNRQMTSDYEKAVFLKKTSDTFLQDQNVAAFFQSIDTIRSDYEHRGVLSALLNQKNLNEKVLAQMLESIARIGSDYEKATFLLEASNLYTGDNRLRSAFLKTVETIKSDHERGRVLSALLKNKQIG